jgi:hypothetical protein
VNDAHVVYGRSNIPLPLTRKGWKIFRLGYIFRAFEHNYLQLMYNMSTVEGKRGKMMAARSLATLMVLAGVPALPFFTLLMKVWGFFTGDDPEQMMRKMATSSEGNEWLANLASDGLPGLIGTSLRGSLQVGAYQDWEDVVFGVAGSTVKDVLWKAPTAAAAGDWDTFAKTVLPTALSNVYKAYQGKTTGVITQRGTPLREKTIGEQIKYSLPEATAKALSFNLTKELNAHRLKQATQMEDDHWARKRQAVYTNFAKGARTGDKALIQSALEDAVAYERERLSRRAVDIPAISHSSLKKSLSESGLQRKQVLQVLRMTGQIR